MRINYKNLIGLPVETKSGLLLGKIKSFEIDSETQNILRYTIKSRNLISKLLSEEANELIIGRNQVVSINEKKMIVEDGAVKEVETAKVMRNAREDAPALTSRMNISRNNGSL
jgi:sporulation protein YlmC with PRC-barrel domain